MGIPRLRMHADAPSRSALKLEEALLVLLDQRERESLRAERDALMDALRAVTQQAFTPSHNGPQWNEGYRSGWNAALCGAHVIASAALAKVQP